MNYKLNTDKTAAVATDTFWQLIDSDTPTGVKMLLINKHFGVAIVSTYCGDRLQWTHWHPLPKFEE